VGGVETRFDNICEYLRTHGYYVYLLTYQPLTTKAWGLPIEEKENLEIHRYWWIGFDLFHKLLRFPVLEVFYLVPMLLFRSFIFLLKKRREIEVIHTPGLAAALIGKVLKGIFKKRLVVSTHTIYEYKKGSLMAGVTRWVLSAADQIIALARLSRDELVEMGLPKEKIVIHTTWVNQEIFKPLNKETSKWKLGWENKFIVLFVGRFIPAKGMDVLLDVARSITEKIYFAFVGSGPLAGEIKRMAGDLANVIYVGQVDNKELNIYYNAADIFVMPSQYKEGFGRVAIEAFSCATPVIGTNMGGIKEVLDLSVAILVRPTAENLKEAILRLYHNPDRRKKLATESRHFARKHFSQKNMTTILKAYDYKEE
jgi:glycosyltransferase involved in cell wall biosynthesis